MQPANQGVRHESAAPRCYGTDLPDTFRQVGLYAARILKGALAIIDAFIVVLQLYLID